MHHMCWTACSNACTHLPPHAQIARIAATTVLCPTGLFVVNEDGGLDKAEEWSPLPDREMGAAANWVHRWAMGRMAVGEGGHAST